MFILLENWWKNIIIEPKNLNLPNEKKTTECCWCVLDWGDILALIRNRTLWEKIIDEIPKCVSSLASPKVKLGHHSHQQHSVVFFSFGKLRFFGSMIMFFHQFSSKINILQNSVHQCNMCITLKIVSYEVLYHTKLFGGLSGHHIKNQKITVLVYYS
jgi:hypothetical protein